MKTLSKNSKSLSEMLVTVLRLIGEALEAQNRYYIALKMYQSALKITRVIGDRYEEGEILMNIARVYYSQSRYTEALATCQQALMLVHKEDDPNPLWKDAILDDIRAIYETHGTVYYDSKHDAEALEMYQQALVIAHEMGDWAGEGISLKNIWQVYETQGRYDEALAIIHEMCDRAGKCNVPSNLAVQYFGQERLEHYAEALESYLWALRQVGGRIEEGAILERTATMYYDQGRLTEAQEIYQQALIITQERSNPVPQFLILNRIGLIYRNQGRFTEALERHQQALSIAHKVNDRDLEGIASQHLGGTYQGLNQYTKALAMYQKALTIAREMKDKRWELEISYFIKMVYGKINQIGGMYKTQGRYAELLEMYEQALTAQREVGDQAWEGTTLNGIGNVYCDQGCYAEALKMYQQALTSHRKISDHANEWVTLSNIGDVYQIQGCYTEALEMYQQALVIQREIGDRANQADTFPRIGAIYQAQKHYAKALEMNQQALVLCQEIGNRVGEGRIRKIIGIIYAAQEHYDEALQNYEQALAIFQEINKQPPRKRTIAQELGTVGHTIRKSDGEELAWFLQQSPITFNKMAIQASEIAILNAIAAVYRNQERHDKASESLQQALTTAREFGQVYDNEGRSSEALAMYHQALDLARELEQRTEEGAILNAIGRLYYQQAQYVEALEFGQQALTIAREINNPDGEGATLMGVGAAQADLGYYAEALESLQQALVIQRDVGNRTLEGNVFNSIGQVYLSQGYYAEALTKFQQGLIICREMNNLFGIGGALAGIGQVYIFQGNYTKALEHLLQAFTILRKAGDHERLGYVFDSIGRIYGSQGRYAEALENFQQALTIRQETGNWLAVGTTLNNIGIIYNDLGRATEALEIHQKALAIWRNVGNRTLEGRTLGNIGAVYDGQGHYAQALESHQKALNILRQAGNRAEEGATLSNIGAAHYNQGRYVEALENWQLGLTIHRELGDRVAEANVLSNIGRIYAVQAQFTEALDAYLLAIDIIETTRITVSSDQGRMAFMAQYADLYIYAIGLYHRQGQDEAAFLASERGRARAFLDSLATGYVELTNNEEAVLLAQEQETYARRQALQDELAKVRALHPPNPQLTTALEAQLAEIEAAYAETLAAIEVRGDQLASLVPGRSTVLGLMEVQALLNEQSTLLSYFILAERTLVFLVTYRQFEVIEIDVSVENLYNRVEYLYQSLDLHQPDVTRSAAQELYQLLITPLVASIHTSHLTIIPHGSLHYLPFAALLDPTTGQYLIQQYTLTLLPSASALPFIQKNAREQNNGPTETESALVIGNPTSPEANLPPLRFAEREAQSIADLYGVQPLLGKAATESAVRERVAHAHILHLAAHGSYNPFNPLYSAILLAPDETYDGQLEVHEVYGLNLKQTDLVVLSACQTQLGQLRAGDEVVGLTRAFFFAGTPTVIASLWCVGDQATAILMERFYGYLKAGVNKAAALRQAQLDMLVDFPDPHYWSGFVLSGDGGEGLTGRDNQTASSTEVS